MEMQGIYCTLILIGEGELNKIALDVVSIPHSTFNHSGVVHLKFGLSSNTVAQKN
jgi:hypothetical protein